MRNFLKNIRKIFISNVLKKLKNIIYLSKRKKSLLINQLKRNISYKLDFLLRSKNLKIAHIFAYAPFNSGDYMIGVATKYYFKKNILKDKEIIFHDFDCRNGTLFNSKNIRNLNKYDYLIVGGGGLILPDTAPNKLSGWQWNISIENLNLIKKPLYVISIGFNLFYRQNMSMTDRNSNKIDSSITPIFKKSIKALIKKSFYFSLRHKGDIKNLIKLIGSKYENKLTYQPCPTIDYLEKKWYPKIKKSKREYIAIEVKDDREWRRYYKITKKVYYLHLLKFVKRAIKNKKKLCFLSHDGSTNFYNYLIENNIYLEILNCNTMNEKDILKNYSKINTLVCHAGHSQMFGYALDIRLISMITHPKLLYFCQDFNLMKDAINVNEEIEKLNTIEL